MGEEASQFCNARKEKCVIYLADLAHNYASKGPYTFPVNIGYVASYAKKLYCENVEIKLFKFPLELINAVKSKQPDIVGFSNYIWNLDLNNNLSSWLKSLPEETVTVFGGPDYPVSYEESRRYFEERPNLDFYVLNQGERGFANIIERYFQCNSLEEMKKTPIDNCSFYDKANDRIILPENYRFIENLEEIPSPYLAGIMDEFFGSNLIPLIETNRGCPYSCAYCAWGKSSQKKIFTFPLERVKQEIEYIAKRTKEVNLLMIGDANFGIFERDVEIAKFLRHIRDTYNYPRDIFVAWAKGSPHRIIEMIEILGDMVGVASTLGSFQSMDLEVMANIKRANMKPEDFKKIRDYLAKKGISTSSELILGLPGETKESHLKALKTMFNQNASSIVCYNLIMLGGSELNSDESRKKFDFKAKYRLIDGGFGRYGEVTAIEHQEVVLSTSTMTMEEILYFRPIHFLIQFLWNYKYYATLISFLKNEGINPVDFISEIVSKKESAPAPVKKLLDDFIKDSYGEWFDTREKLVEHYSQTENFEFISKGGFGKLNYRYIYRFLLECKHDFDDYLFDIARDILKKEKKFDESKKEQLDNLLKYTRNVFIDFSENLDKLDTERIAELKYDIPRWEKEAFKGNLPDYAGNIKLKFTLPDEQIKKLKELFKQFQGEDINQTLRKMVEYMNEKDLFYLVNYTKDLYKENNKNE